MSVLDLVLVIARLGLGCWLLWRLPVPKSSSVGRPPCSVIIPARNEELVLGMTLAALVPQLGAADEIVVVDDHSTDCTAEIAGRAGGRVRVLPAPALPEGWTGKCWACWTGVARTSAPVLCFIDADTRLASGMLDRLVGQVAEGDAAGGAMVSVQPWHEVRGVIERGSAFFNLLAIMGTGMATPVAHRVPPRGAFGPVIAVRRADYDALGGHRAVAGDVLDDVGLADVWRDAGHAVHLYGGRSVATFRMYPDGWRALVQGWSKNIAAGAAAVRRLDVVLAIAWLSVCLQATWWLLRMTTGASAGELIVGAALYVVTALHLGWLLRRVGSFGWVTALLYPVPLLFFLVVFVRSLVLAALGRSVRWKGRTLPSRRPGRPSQPAVRSDAGASGSGASGSAEGAGGRNRCSR